MQRAGFSIKSTVAKRSFRMTAHEQYQVVGTKCYPLYYDISTSALEREGSEIQPSALTLGFLRNPPFQYTL